jgi:beta-alanine--pyruvate transaminase
MGGIIVREEIFQSFMGAGAPAHAIELFHGYTYSGHPMAAACGHAALDVLQEEGLIKRARELEPVLENAMHALKGEPGVTDIRNMGLAAAVDFDPIPGKPGLRGMKVFERGLEEGFLLRVAGDAIAVGPPFISTADEITRMGEGIRRAIRHVFAQGNA